MHTDFRGLVTTVVDGAVAVGWRIDIAEDIAFVVGLEAVYRVQKSGLLVKNST